MPMKQQDISAAKVTAKDVSLSEGYAYADVTVTIDGEKLVKGRDYILEGCHTVEAEGTYTVTVAGIGLYCGSVDVKYKVSAAMRGDVNGDGKLNMKDLVLLQRYLNNWNVAVVDAASDMNGDGKINMKDYVLLQRLLNGWNV